VFKERKHEKEFLATIKPCFAARFITDNTHNPFVKQGIHQPNKTETPVIQGMTPLTVRVLNRINYIIDIIDERRPLCAAAAFHSFMVNGLLTLAGWNALPVYAVFELRMACTR